MGFACGTAVVSGEEQAGHHRSHGQRISSSHVRAAASSGNWVNSCATWAAVSRSARARATARCRFRTAGGGGGRFCEVSWSCLPAFSIPSIIGAGAIVAKFSRAFCQVLPSSINFFASRCGPGFHPPWPRSFALLPRSALWGRPTTMGTPAPPAPAAVCPFGRASPARERRAPLRGPGEGDRRCRPVWGWRSSSLVCGTSGHPTGPAPVSRRPEAGEGGNFWIADRIRK